MTSCLVKILIERELVATSDGFRGAELITRISTSFLTVGKGIILEITRSIQENIICGFVGGAKVGTFWCGHVCSEFDINAPRWTKSITSCSSI